MSLARSPFLKRLASQALLNQVLIVQLDTLISNTPSTPSKMFQLVVTWCYDRKLHWSPHLLDCDGINSWRG